MKCTAALAGTLLLSSITAAGEGTSVSFGSPGFAPSPQ